MVRILTGIFVSLSLLLGISFYELGYMNRESVRFSEALTALYEKTEEKTATTQDAEAVKIMWNEKKKHFHVWVPHNDVSYVDYWLNEAIGYLHTEKYDEALSKITVLREICKNLPAAYSFSWENIL